MRRFIATITLCLFVFTSLPVTTLAEEMKDTLYKIKTKISQNEQELEKANNEDISRKQGSADTQTAGEDKYIKREYINKNLTSESFKYAHSRYYQQLKKEGKLDILEQAEQQNIDPSELLSTGEEDETVTLMSSSNTDWYNALVGPSVMNGTNEPKYSAFSNQQEIISPLTGDLTLKYNDISLPGRNGLDLNIGRIYQSNQALLGDKRISEDGLWQYPDYSTYYMSRYALGVGWAFNFPSVQIERFNNEEELYYHTGNGDIYHVDWGGSYSNLENYYKEDARFSTKQETFSNGQVSAKYQFTTADQTKQFFAADGRLIGIKDRFDNQIIFKHQEMPVANYAPNSDFEYPINEYSWKPRVVYRKDEVMQVKSEGCGKDDDTALKLAPPDANSKVSCESIYIPVLPNTKYYFSTYVKMLNTTRGDFYISCSEHKKNYTKISTYEIRANKGIEGWQLLEKSFTTHEDARYVRLDLECMGSTMYVDKVRFAKLEPLISEITDSIGRKITFEYNNNLFEDDADVGDIILKVEDPSKTKEYSITYKRSRILCETSWNNELTEETRYYNHCGVIDNEGQETTYMYNAPTEKEYFSFLKKKKDSNSAYSTRMLISDIEYRNSSVHYDYEKVTKHLGTHGFHEIRRVSSRHENYHDIGGINGINQNTKTYTFGSPYGYDNETGYPDYETEPICSMNQYGYYCIMTQDNNLQIKTSFFGYRERSIEKKDLSTGETETIYYDSYHRTFKDSPLEVRQESYMPQKGTNTLYTIYTYNDWGGLESETLPLTKAQKENSATKAKYTISYTYDPTFKFLKTKSYYQDINKEKLTETINYDSQGRIQSTVNAKGEVTEYKYEDVDNTVNPSKAYPGNVTEVKISNINNNGDGTDSITIFDYSEGYHAFPTTIIQKYKENGVEKESRTYNTYEYIHGNLISVKDANLNETIYDYDNVGRLKKVTYPSSLGKDGEYIVEDNYVYNNSVPVPAHNNRELFEVRSYRTKRKIGQTTATIVSDSYSYYDDHGNIMYSKIWNDEHNSWVSMTYSYDEYGRLDWVKDEKNNKTSYTFDSFGRIKTITDARQSVQKYEYDSYNRTMTTYFIPASAPATQENHYVETYDQWGRIISRKGYPEGINSSKVVEEKYEYDIVGNLTKLTDARLYETLFQYDALNQLEKVTNAKGEEVEYNYTKLGTISSFKQYGEGKTYTTTNLYDERGLLLSKQGPGKKPMTYKYNSVGLPYEVTDASGKITTMRYDNNNRLQEIKANKDKVKNYYHPLGGIEKYEVSNDDTGMGEHLTYDFYSTGLVKERKQGSYATTFEYDIIGNIKKVTDPFSLEVNYTPDTLNRLHTVEVDGKTFVYEYYDDGMIKSITYPDTGKGTLQTTYTYDNINRMTTMTNKLGTKIISQFSYEYDNNGNITKITENGDVTEYEYDELNRLSAVKIPGVRTITYTYDSRGNRATQSDTLKSDQTVIPGSFTYNSWDQMSTFTSGMNTYEYKYDPQGLRIQKMGPNENIRYHLDDNGRVIAESDGSGQVKAQNIWGYQVLSRKIDGKYYYYIYNGHGDVIQIVDESGNIVNTYKYDEWGNLLFKDEEIYNPIRYCGEYQDLSSGLIYLRARYYDPSIGRFISEDPYWNTHNMIYGDNPNSDNPVPDITAIMQSSNLYVYGMNNPIKWIDPSGMVAGEHFSSPDEAAKDWAWNYYGSSDYVRFECASLIYMDWDEDGNIFYSYTYGVWGEAHSVNPSDAQKFVPDSAVVFSVIHSHPNSTEFSSADKNYAKSRSWSIYVVVKGSSGVDIKKYADTRRGYKESTIVTGMSVASLSDKRKKDLQKKFKAKWDAHVKDGCPQGFGCEHKTWPRT